MGIEQVKVYADYNNTISEACKNYLYDHDLQKYAFDVSIYQSCDKKNIRKRFSQVVIRYPSLNVHYPEFDQTLMNFIAYVSGFLKSNFDYPIPLETNVQEPYENTVRKLIAQAMQLEIVPVTVDGNVISLRADHYDLFRDQVREALKAQTEDLGVFIHNPIQSYDVIDSLHPFKEVYGSGGWDYVDEELFHLGYFNYANNPIMNINTKEQYVNRSHRESLAKINNTVCDVTSMSNEISQLIIDETRTSSDNDESIIVFPLTGGAGLMLEVFSDQIITRDNVKGDYYKPLIFEGKEIILAPVELYDCMLWVMSARSNLINLMIKNRNFFNDLLRVNSLPWVLKYVLITDSLLLSERERFLLESSLMLMKQVSLFVNWCWVDLFGISQSYWADQHMVLRMFNREFRDRFKSLDSRVGRFNY